MVATVLLIIFAIVLYIFDPDLDGVMVRNVFGLAFLFQLFYVIGSLFEWWPMPQPLSIVQIIVVVALGMGLGVNFARFWPIPEQTGTERVIRTFLIGVPAIGIGIGFQLLLQGPRSRQALYLIFALSAWLGSGNKLRSSKDRKRRNDDDLSKQER